MIKNAKNSFFIIEKLKNTESAQLHQNDVDENPGNYDLSPFLLLSFDK